jgi:hypothetical protein
VQFCISLPARLRTGRLLARDHVPLRDDAAARIVARLNATPPQQTRGERRFFRAAFTTRGF